jgi:hypothetical protein
MMSATAGFHFGGDLGHVEPDVGRQAPQRRGIDRPFQRDQRVMRGL